MLPNFISNFMLKAVLKTYKSFSSRSSLYNLINNYNYEKWKLKLKQDINIDYLLEIKNGIIEKKREE